MFASWRSRAALATNGPAPDPAAVRHQRGALVATHPPWRIRAAGYLNRIRDHTRPASTRWHDALARRTSAARKSRLRSTSPDPRGWSRVVPACDGPAQALPQCIEGELALVRRASAARKSRLRSASPDPRGWSRVVPACDGPAQCVESRVSPLPALSSLPAPCVSPPPNSGPGSAAAPPRPRASSRFPRPSLPAPSPDTPRASPGCLCRLALPPLAPWGELRSMYLRYTDARTGRVRANQPVRDASSRTNFFLS